MARRKIGDKVVVKSKYFNPFNDLEGVITSIDDTYEKIVVDIEHKGEQLFEPNELRKAP